MRWRADENFNHRIVRGLRFRNPTLDLVRAQDVGLLAFDDPSLLEWAAKQRRMILTHDMRTMPGYVYSRIERGLTVPGVIQVRRTLLLSAVIDEILLMDACGQPGEWDGQVVYLPLR